MEAAMKRVATLLFAYYPQDVRARRECEALSEAGIDVDVVALQLDGEKEEETVNGVHVYRLPVQKQRAGKLNYVLQYASFVLRSSLKLSQLHMAKSYHCIHAHNMPDILVFAAIFPKLTGSKVLLDLRDPMPELFMTKFSVQRSHPFIRLLMLLEALSVRFADSAITPNISFRDLFISRGCPPEKISIVMNAPMERLFNAAAAAPGPAVQDAGSFILMFHGTILERHGIDTALEAVSELRNEIPGLELRLFGEGDFSCFEGYLQEQRLEGVVRYHGVVPWEQIPREIRGIDLGIVSNKKTPFTDLNFPGRIFEYLSLGKPVIAPKSRGVLDYFDEESIFFFDPGSSASLTEAIRRVYRDPDLVRRVVARGMEVYRQHRWELQKRSYLEQVKRMIGA
jgi:glycosyltransferase involved in cell wall biosynthesis